MAKKSTSYSPNVALIQGQRQVAESQALADMAGGTAFAKSFTGTIIKGIEEQEKRNSIREAYLDDLQNPQNLRKIEDGFNKKQITEFLNNKKNEYAKAADCYARTRDRGCKEQMEDIKYSFSNLNTQLDLYLNDKKSYLDSFQNGQIVDLPGDEKYTELYTNKGTFSIEENGDLGFTTQDGYNKYNDIVGKWNVNNNIYDTHVLKSSFEATLRGQAGKKFNRDLDKNATAAVLKGTGYDGVMTATKSDFGFDDDYILPNGQKAGKLTFEYMFANGMLADKYYDGSLTGTRYGKKREGGKGWDLGEDGAKWFWDKNNSKDLTNLVAEYSTDVNESMHKPGFDEYQAEQTRNRATQVSNQPYRQESIAKSKKIEEILAKGKDMTVSDLRGLSMEATQSRTIRPIKEGDYEGAKKGDGFVILSGQGYPTYIMFDNLNAARQELYGLSNVAQIDRIGGEEINYTKFKPE